MNRFFKFSIILACFMFVFAGCYSVLSHKDKEPDTAPETPSDQMWQAVKKSNWMVTISILGIAAGTFAFLNGSKIGFPAIISSCVSLFMSLAVARYAEWMAVCGLIGSIVACTISVIVKKKALVDIIKGVQKVKNGKQDIQQTVIDKDKFNETLASVQSNSTKKIVQQIKSTLKLNGEIA